MTMDDEERQTRAVHRLLLSFGSPRSYGLVIVMIVVTYGLAIQVAQPVGATVVLFVQIWTVWLALRTSHARRWLRSSANVMFALAGILAVVSLFQEEGDELLRYLFMASSLLYFIAPISIVRNIAFHREVDRETMLGALAAYLLIGMAFAFAYRFVAAVESGPFFGSGGDGTIADSLFFSFVTLTTTGYGNLVPEGNPGQSMAVVEALLGQLFLVTAVGKLVNNWKPKAWRDDGPVPPTD